jgi:transcriptional regulator with XRE-family HTH domain
MAKKTAALLPSTDELLHQFGDRLRLARLRRRFSAKQVAQRAGMAPMTLRSLERGGSGVTMGAYLAVMQVLGIEKDLDLLGKADPVGRQLQDAQLPAHTKASRPHPSPPAKPPTAPDQTAPLTGAASQLVGAIESTPYEQLRKVLDSLSSEQLRKALASISDMRPPDTTGRLDSSNGDVEKLPTPSQDTQDWIKRGGFASADTLAGMLDPKRSQKKKAG